MSKLLTATLALLGSIMTVWAVQAADFSKLTWMTENYPPITLLKRESSRELRSNFC